MKRVESAIQRRLRDIELIGESARRIAFTRCEYDPDVRWGWVGWRARRRADSRATDASAGRLTVLSGAASEPTTLFASVCDTDNRYECQRGATVVDPINYDIAELRALAAETNEATRTEACGFRWMTPPQTPPERVPPEGFLTPEQRRRLLLLHDVAFDPADTTPVLRTLPADRPALAFTWLEYLLAIAGTNGAKTALGQYHEVGWLTEAVRESLHEYLAWLAPRHGDGGGVLEQADHLLSFAYVAALAARQSAHRTTDREIDADG